MGVLTVVGPEERAEIPAPPKVRRKDRKTSSLLPEVAEAWDLFWTSAVSTLVEPGSDLPALRRLFLLYDERERMLRHVAENGRMTTGSTGQAVLDPLYKELGSIDGRITALEDRFGLTPMARLKLGVTLGEAHKSLDQMNERMADDGQDEDDDELDDDPRLAAVIDTTAR